jgi:hypothetical protein
MKNDQFKTKISRIWHFGAPVSDPAQDDRIAERAGSETGVPTWRKFLNRKPILSITAGEIKIMIKSRIKR